MGHIHSHKFIKWELRTSIEHIQFTQYIPSTSREINKKIYFLYKLLGKLQSDGYPVINNWVNTIAMKLIYVLDFPLGNDIKVDDDYFGIIEDDEENEG